MNRFTLKFSNKNIESEYSNLKHSAVSENIKLTIFFPVLFEISVGIPEIIEGHLLGFLVTLGIIGLFVIIACLSNKLQRYRRFITFVVISSFLFARPYYILHDLESHSKLDFLIRGFSMATLQISIMTRFPGLGQKILGVFIAFGLKFSLMAFLDEEIVEPGHLVYYTLVDCFMIYVFYSNEHTERTIFLNSWESRENFRKFKELVENYLPQSIVIFSPWTNKCLFANKATTKVFQKSYESTPPVLAEGLLSNSTEDELAKDIGCLEIEQGTVNVMSPSQSFQKFSRDQILLKDLIRHFATDFNADNKALSLSAFRMTEDNKQTFRVILTKIKWDKENAIAIVLNDTTEHENLLALKIADENKDKTLATVSHELRTPLNGIIGILGMAEAKIADLQVLEYLGLCKDNAHLLLGLVNSILDFQQIKQGKLKLNVTKVKIEKVLSDITRLFHFQCSQKGISLDLDIDKETPAYVSTDENRLKQILINLVGNAIKFTSKGGITIGVAPKIVEADSLTVWVSDSGIGIKDEDIGKLFKMYGKLKDGESINKNGVGLGLTISNALSQLLSGRTDDGGIQVESKYGKGTTFMFELAKNIEKQIEIQVTGQKDDIEPLNFEDDSSSENDIDEITGEFPHGTSFQLKITQCNSNSMLLKGLISRKISYNLNADKSDFYLEDQLRKIKMGTVLIVDDNPFNIMVARNTIDKLGYECETANNGSEAIDKVKDNALTSESYKVILMDQNMPILDGIAATKILKGMMEKGDIPVIPIVALTANNDENSIKECYECGMSDYLPKPFRSDDFSNLLSRLK